MLDVFIHFLCSVGSDYKFDKTLQKNLLTSKSLYDRSK